MEATVKLTKEQIECVLGNMEDAQHAAGDSAGADMHKATAQLRDAYYKLLGDLEREAAKIRNYDKVTFNVDREAAKIFGIVPETVGQVSSHIGQHTFYVSFYSVATRQMESVEVSRNQIQKVEV